MKAFNEALNQPITIPLTPERTSSKNQPKKISPREKRLLEQLRFSQLTSTDHNDINSLYEAAVVMSQDLRNTRTGFESQNNRNTSIIHTSNSSLSSINIEIVPSTPTSEQPLKISSNSHPKPPDSPASISSILPPKNSLSGSRKPDSVKSSRLSTITQNFISQTKSLIRSASLDVLKDAFKNGSSTSLDGSGSSAEGHHSRRSSLKSVSSFFRKGRSRSGSASSSPDFAVKRKSDSEFPPLESVPEMQLPEPIESETTLTDSFTIDPDLDPKDLEPFQIDIPELKTITLTWEETKRRKKSSISSETLSSVLDVIDRHQQEQQNTSGSSSPKPDEEIYVPPSNVEMDTLQSRRTSKNRPKHIVNLSGITIETENPSNLFWVPAHLHPEVHPDIQPPESQNWFSTHSDMLSGQNTDEMPGSSSTFSRSLSRNLGPSPLRRSKSYMESFEDPNREVNSMPKYSTVGNRVRRTSAKSKKIRANGKRQSDVIAKSPKADIKHTIPEEDLASKDRYSWGEDSWVAAIALQTENGILDNTEIGVEKPQTDADANSNVSIEDSEQKLFDRKKRRSKRFSHKSKSRSKVVMIGSGEDAGTLTIVKDNKVPTLPRRRPSDKSSEEQPEKKENDLLSVSEMLAELRMKSPKSVWPKVDTIDADAENNEFSDSKGKEVRDMELDDESDLFIPVVEEQGSTWNDLTSQDGDSESITPSKKSHTHGYAKKWSWFVDLVRHPKNSENSGKKSNRVSPEPSPEPSSPISEAGDEITPLNSFTDGPRLPLHLEKRVYQTSHRKLVDHKRTLAEQVIISNLMLYIISVHADVTLNRQGPRGRKGKRRKRSRSPGARQVRRQRSGLAISAEMMERGDSDISSDEGENDRTSSGNSYSRRYGNHPVNGFGVPRQMDEYYGINGQMTPISHPQQYSSQQYPSYTYQNPLDYAAFSSTPTSDASIIASSSSSPPIPPQQVPLVRPDKVIYSNPSVIPILHPQLYPGPVFIQPNSIQYQSQHQSQVPIFHMPMTPVLMPITSNSNYINHHFIQKPHVPPLPPPIPPQQQMGGSSSTVVENKRGRPPPIIRRDNQIVNGVIPASGVYSGKPSPLNTTNNSLRPVPPLLPHAIEAMSSASSEKMDVNENVNDEEEDDVPLGMLQTRR